jgi:hypothetical protein
MKQIIPLLFLAAAATAHAYPILVYKALDKSSPSYTLHDPSTPLYQFKGKNSYASYILRDPEAKEQVTITYGVESKRKVYFVNLATPGSWASVVKEDYAPRLRSYTYPANRFSALRTSVHFELRNIAATAATPDTAGTYHLSGVEKLITLKLAEYETQAPLSLKGSGISYNVSYYVEDPANLKDFSGNLITLASVSTTYTLSLKDTDRVNIESAAPIDGQAPGTLPYATANVVGVLGLAGYQLKTAN